MSISWTVLRRSTRCTSMAGRVAAMAMGDAGLWTRIPARKFHAFATYSSMEGAVPTAPGQLSIREMIDDFRWNAIDGETRVFGVLADPVGHSLSPSLINRWFGEHGVNGVFVPLRVARDGAGLSGFLDGCAARPWLDLGGFSVTVPHKASARQWLGEPSIRLLVGSARSTRSVFATARPRGSTRTATRPFRRWWTLGGFTGGIGRGIDRHPGGGERPAPWRPDYA